MRSIILATVALAVATPTAAQVILPTSKRFPAAQKHFREIVKANLIDPDSAKFGSTFICEYSPTLKMAIVKVNSKNRFGGYTGTKAALVMDLGGDARVLFPSAEGETVPEIQLNIKSLELAQQCVGKVRDAAVAAGAMLPDH